MKTLIPNILVMAAMALGVRVGSNTKPPPPSRAKLLNATASCYDAANGNLVGSQKSHTSLLVSPDGIFRAYGESDAVVGGVSDKPECRNTSKLFIAGPGQSFHPVLTVEFSADAPGNSIAIIDWSPRGHRLLLEQGFWQYGSDVGGTVVRIYDADSAKLSSESLMDDAFRQYVGKKCAATLSALGFSRNGDAVVRVAPYFDYGEAHPAEDSCVQKPGLWLVNSAIPSVRQLAGRYTPQRFGRITPMCDNHGGFFGNQSPYTPD